MIWISTKKVQNLTVLLATLLAPTILTPSGITTNTTYYQVPSKKSDDGFWISGEEFELWDFLEVWSWKRRRNYEHLVQQKKLAWTVVLQTK
jgi:hypothetical protein